MITLFNFVSFYFVFSVVSPRMQHTSEELHRLKLTDLASDTNDSVYSFSFDLFLNENLYRPAYWRFNSSVKQCKYIFTKVKLVSK